MSHDVTVELTHCDVHLSFTAPGELMYLWLYEAGSDEKDDAPRIEMAVLTQDDWKKLQRVVAENHRWDEGG
ncbi:MAG TPA: hypothetical protein VHK64_03990 [Nocardioidaceae bacterium]|nr:hypothetical protein [Nocardioidaceae bacterium]